MYQFLLSLILLNDLDYLGSVLQRKVQGVYPRFSVLLQYNRIGLQDKVLVDSEIPLQQYNSTEVITPVTRVLDFIMYIHELHSISSVATEEHRVRSEIVPCTEVTRPATSAVLPADIGYI